MTGVVYYNKGMRCAVRLCVSVYTLRKHYKGPCCVLIEGKVEAWLPDVLEFLGVSVKILKDTGQRPLVRKASLWRDTPFEHTMFIDADTTIHKPIDAYFDLLDGADFVTGGFCGWKTSGSKMSGRIRQWAPVIGRDGVEAALAYGPAINTGITGWRLGSPFLEEWEAMTQAGHAAGCTRIMVDELACQVLLHQHPKAVVADETWGSSAVYGKCRSPHIIHYHGDKHARPQDYCEPWKRAYRELLAATGHRKELMVPHGDGQLRNYLKELIPLREGLTVVTAVNPGYRDKFKANFAKWMEMDWLKDQEFVVFANRRPDLAFLDGYDNVRVVPWRFPIAGDNIRERMLSAFVFGVAAEVQTDYWMKLDADATPKVGEFKPPLYRKATITGHRCGYTKTKWGNVEEAKKSGLWQDRHFLNILDDWYEGLTGEAAAYEEIIPRSKHGDQRVASFCWFEKTAFTKDLAKLCDKRLPIPSHDTTAWYVAMRQGRDIVRDNFKRSFAP